MTQRRGAVDVDDALMARRLCVGKDKECLDEGACVEPAYLRPMNIVLETIAVAIGIVVVVLDAYGLRF